MSKKSKVHTMTEQNNNRWIQRFNTYKKALTRLKEVIDLYKSRDLTPLEKDGMVQRFEYTEELAWKVLKNYLEYQGGVGEKMAGSRDVIRQASAYGIIENAEPWFEMLESRDTTTHVYDEDTEMNVIDEILNTFYPILNDLQVNMEKRRV